MRLSLLSTNWFATSAKLMLSRVFLWTCINISACKLIRGMFLRAENMRSLSAFVACESKSNLTVFSASLIKKFLFRYISCNFLIPLSLSSSKLDNNFNCDTILLISSPRCKVMLMIQQFISCWGYFFEYCIKQETNFSHLIKLLLKTFGKTKF